MNYEGRHANGDPFLFLPYKRIFYQIHLRFELVSGKHPLSFCE